jgi:hypothetical protein
MMREKAQLFSQNFHRPPDLEFALVPLVFGNGANAPNRLAQLPNKQAKPLVMSLFPAKTP